jgi:dTDP-4-amino-4,6-dideoxy-D-galactose acyltransferase
MIVAESNRKLVGFLLLLKSDSEITIDLIGVAAEAQRQGWGRYLIAYAHQVSTQYETMVVGTQATNIPSVRLYESLGFRLRQSSYVFHYHRPVATVPS